MTVNGQLLGSRIEVSAGDSVDIKATASINPSLDKLDRLELVLHGEVIASLTSEEGAEKLELRHTLQPRESA